MTLKTSFFNKGIYKSTLKRYIWGSILYFIILFFNTPMSIMMKSDTGTQYYHYYTYSDKSLMDMEYMIIPFLLMVVIPVIVSVLIFKYLHSKNHAVFAHSIPVSRGANYFSNILAGFTLMYLPIVANGVILIIMLLSGYDAFFTAASCVEWMLCNMYGLFLIFSCAVFASSITGRGYAAVAINILIHIFLLLIVFSFKYVAEMYLYGFVASGDFFDSVGKCNFINVVYGFSNGTTLSEMHLTEVVMYTVFALAFYVGAYVLCIKRKIESSSDVAGFKCLNSIFKYFVTFLASMLAFAAAAVYIEESPAFFVIIVAVVMVITYAVSEMLLRKTLNVLYAWKGLVCFAGFFTVLIVIFVFTSFFGYETRVPDNSEIEKVLVDYFGPVEYYTSNEASYMTDEEFIADVTSVHSKLTETKPKLLTNGNEGLMLDYDYNLFIVKYELKNGKSFDREYLLETSEMREIINALYANESYKKIVEPIFMDSSQITDIEVNGWYTVTDYEAFLAAIREDYLRLGYNDLYPINSWRHQGIVRIEYKTKNPYDNNFETIKTMEISINEKFEKTLEYFKNVGLIE